MKEYYAVIMAGGRGERFWPMSTSRRPKQLLKLVGDKPLITAAVERLDGLIPAQRILVITNDELIKATSEALPSFPEENIIGEPFGRDTAAAVALGAVLVKARNPKSAFCVLTADHLIGDIEVFQQTLKQAFAIALSSDVLLTIGIKPCFASTGFGYIETADSFKHEGRVDFFKVKRFVEKPDAATAEQYLEASIFFWNSGMFIWSVDSLQRALSRHMPVLVRLMERLEPVIGTNRFQNTLKSEYEKLEKISIDYALMEKADNIVMAKGVFAWDDIGSWSALENHFQKDAQGNIVIGKGETLDSSGNIIVSEQGLVTLIGVNDLIVVKSGDSILVCPKDRAQDVKKMVKQISDSKKYAEYL